MKKRRQDDELKTDACKKYGVKLIVIPYFKKLDSLENIIKSVEQCVKKSGLKTPKNWDKKNLD